MRSVTGSSDGLSVNICSEKWYNSKERQANLGLTHTYYHLFGNISVTRAFFREYVKREIYPFSKLYLKYFTKLCLTPKLFFKSTLGQDDTCQGNA